MSTKTPSAGRTTTAPPPGSYQRMASKLPQQLRRLSSTLYRRPILHEPNSGTFLFQLVSPPRKNLDFPFLCDPSPMSSSTGPLNVQGPTAIDYGSLLQEDEFHRLADNTIHHLQEKLEEYGDEVELDGFDIDYGNDVLTLKLGDLGTYVINKQTPNRQIWLSSPVSGPSRFVWDQESKAWVYRRTAADLFNLLQAELVNLCGQPIELS